MATITNTLQVAGFTQAGNPATGSGLIASKTINLWSDGSITFTNAAGTPRQIADNYQLNALLKEILVGASGVSTAKQFTT